MIQDLHSSVLPFEEDELRVYAQAGYGRPLELGRRAALIGVDFTNEFCGPEGSTLEEAMAVDPLACGDDAWAAARTVVERLLPAVAAHGLPAIWLSRDEPSTRPRIGDGEPTDEDAFRNRQIAPIAEYGYGRSMTKRAPSAFFGTGLATLLRQDGVDTVLLAGAVTSGCVRASAVDAMSHGFRVIVISDGVVDRSRTSHAVALFEMSMKYAAVAPAATVAARLLSATTP